MEGLITMHTLKKVSTHIKNILLVSVILGMIALRLMCDGI